MLVRRGLKPVARPDSPEQHMRKEKGKQQIHDAHYNLACSGYRQFNDAPSTIRPSIKCLQYNNNNNNNNNRESEL
jgi:hypothetical protein